MSDTDPEDGTIKTLIGDSQATEKGIVSDAQSRMPAFTATAPEYYPNHSYLKFNTFIEAAHKAMGDASHNATTTSSAASGLVAGATGQAATRKLELYIQDVSMHMNVIGEYFGTKDAAQAYSLVLENAKRAIVFIQQTFNTAYKNAAQEMATAKTTHETNKDTSILDMDNSTTCKKENLPDCVDCKGAAALSHYNAAYQLAKENAETQIELVKEAREAMINAVRGIVTGGTGGQVFAQAAQTGQGAMSGMDASMVSGIMSGIGQILQVPSSLISGLAQQGSGLITGLVGQIASVASQAGAAGGGAAPTSAEEKDDVTVVKKQGPKLGEFITNQKKSNVIVSSAPAGGGGSSAAAPAKPTAKTKARPALKINFDPDVKTGWGTTAASADIQGEGRNAAKANVRVPFKINKS